MALSRATVFETVQLGVESLVDPGTAVSATKKLQGLGFMLTPKFETSRFRPNGFKYDTLVIPGKEWTEYSVEGRLDYDNIRYALASVINSPTIAVLGTNGRTWTFESASNSPDVLQTYTVDTGSTVRASRSTGVSFTGLDITFKRDEAMVSGSCIGREMDDPIYMTGPEVTTLEFTGTVSGGTFTVTYNAVTSAAIAFDATAEELQLALWNVSTIGPGNVFVAGGPGPADFILQWSGALASTDITVTVDDASLTGTTPGITVTTTQAYAAISDVEAVPVVPGNVNVYVDSTFAGIGTTKLTRVLEATLSISDRISPLWVLNSSNGSFAATLETPPNVTGKLKMEANAAGMAYLSTIRAGSTVYIRIEAEGDALPAPDAGQNYLFRWDMAAKVESPDSMGDTDGAYTIDWTFRGVHDADMGGMLSVVLQNLATAL